MSSQFPEVHSATAAGSGPRNAVKTPCVAVGYAMRMRSFASRAQGACPLGVRSVAPKSARHRAPESVEQSGAVSWGFPVLTGPHTGIYTLPTVAAFDPRSLRCHSGPEPRRMAGRGESHGGK